MANLNPLLERTRAFTQSGAYDEPGSMYGLFMGASS